jgi:hypothetical protein
MRLLTLTILFLLWLMAHAQSGPAGVGSSSNNVLWLDANSGVTQSGGLVSQWNDRSGNSNHALLPGSIPTAQPAFVNSSVNGYPSLDFDGTDDQLWVTDHATLDLAQWHFFIVVTADLQKNYNAWMVKGDDSDENFEMLSYNDGNIHTPTKYTDGTRTIPSSAGGQVTTTTFDVIEYSYSTGVGRDVYKNAANVITDNENKTPRVNNLPLYIGNERSTTGREVNGDIAEVIAYNAPLNTAQRRIVNNYLAAKYGRTLASGDMYVQDNVGNGNYDHDVAGIGRVDGSNTQTDSRGSGIVQIGKAGYGGLGDDEFLFWGHDNATLGAYGSTDFPSGLQGRLHRVWRVSEVNSSGSAVNVGNTDITFDLAGLGSVTASDLRLLVDTDGDGVFADETPISGATNVSGTLYRFANSNALQDGRRFTLGTINMGNTPLPVELLSFEGRALSATSALLEWSTASERNNDFFTIERSIDAVEWLVAGQVDGAGNSTSQLNYSLRDESAPGGLCYYRLRQTDMDGTSMLSDVVTVRMEGMPSTRPYAYPNPSAGPMIVVLPDDLDDALGFTLVDPKGGAKPIGFQKIGPGRYRVDPGPVPSGTYLLQAYRPSAEVAYHVRIVR